MHNFQAATGRMLLGMAHSSGPVALKAVQFLSTQSGVLPEPTLQELRKSCHGVPALPLDQLELGGRESLKKVRDLSPLPIGSASIAQVHRGKRGKHLVAVKIVRPGLHDSISKAQSIARMTLGAMESWDMAAAGGSEGLCAFLDRVEEEGDMKAEHQRVLKLASGLDPRVSCTPRPICSDQNTLVMQWVPPRPFPRSGTPSARSCAHTLMLSHLRQALSGNWFQTDTNEGNVALAEDGRFVWYDCGQLAQLPVGCKQGLIQAAQQLMQGDVEAAVDWLFVLGLFRPQTERQPLVHALEGLWREVQENGTDSIMRSMHMIQVQQCADPCSGLFLLGRSLCLLLPICQRMDPGFDLRGVLCEAVL